MFQEDPLPPHLFVYYEYSYEDVLFCNLLYFCLRDLLESHARASGTCPCSFFRAQCPQPCSVLTCCGSDRTSGFIPSGLP
eukprot:5517498-Prymnesium_polylepis.1